MREPTTSAEPAGREYIMGHSADEQRRLDEQGAYLRPYTERMLRSAGIGEGMRVLDVGCGTGDVTMLAADLVGPSGEVIGIDRSADVIATARRRGAGHGARHVRFEEAALDAFTDADRFDAVVGRLVLIHQLDRVAALRSCAALVRVGGVIAFADYAFLVPPKMPPRPTFTRAMELLLEAFERIGCPATVVTRFPQLFRAAGLPTPERFIEIVPIDDTDLARCRWFQESFRHFVPVVVRAGLATEQEIGIDTLAERMVEEARPDPTTLITVCFGAAWARL